MLCQNPVREVVGLPLGLVVIFGHLKGRPHDACVVDQAVEGCFEGEKVVSGRDNASEIHEVHLQEVDVG